MCKASILSDGSFIHGHMKRTLDNPSGFLENSALKMCCECGSLVDADRMFDEMSERHLVSWATLISAYARKGFPGKAFSLLAKMIELGITPTSTIYIGLLRALVKPSCLEIGKQLHSHAIRSGIEDSVSLETVICNMYVKCGWLDGAENIFRHMSEKNTVSWTGLMTGYAQGDRQEKALGLFKEMMNDGIELYEYTFSVALKACVGLQKLRFGRQIHGLIAKLGLESEVSAGTPLVDFYVKCGSLESASKAFDRISEPNDFLWSARITGYCQNGQFEKSLKKFKSLRSRSVDINPFTYTSIFQACSALEVFNMGAQAHADAIKRSLVAVQHGQSALITMYSRYGRLDYASEAFDSIIEPDAVAWTAIIAGYAYQGKASEALELFRRMQDYAIRPNAITFIAVLTACSHAGLVTEGKQYLESMSSVPGCPNYRSL